MRFSIIFSVLIISASVAVIAQNMPYQTVLTYNVTPQNKSKNNYMVKTIKIYFWNAKNRIEMTIENPENPQQTQFIVTINDKKGEYSISEGNLEPNLFGKEKVAIFSAKPNDPNEEFSPLYEPIFCDTKWTNEELKIYDLIANKIVLTACDSTIKNSVVYALKMPLVNLGKYFPEVQSVYGVPIFFDTKIGGIPVKVTLTNAKKTQALPALYRVPENYKIISAQAAIDYLKGYR